MIADGLRWVPLDAAIGASFGQPGFAQGVQPAIEGVRVLERMSPGVFLQRGDMGRHSAEGFRGGVRLLFSAQRAVGNRQTEV